MQPADLGSATTLPIGSGWIDRDSGASLARARFGQVPRRKGACAYAHQFSKVTPERRAGSGRATPPLGAGIRVGDCQRAGSQPVSLLLQCCAVQRPMKPVVQNNSRSGLQNIYRRATVTDKRNHCGSGQPTENRVFQILIR